MTAAPTTSEPIESIAPLGKIAVTMQSSFLGFFAHAGFLNALVDSGVRPAKIAGASSGSLVAAAYACGLEGDALREFILNRKLQRAFREWQIPLRGPAVFGAYFGHGIINGRRAVRYLQEALPVDRIENTPNAELSIGVTNLTRGARQIKTHGEVAPFVIASCAVTPVIRSQEIDGEFYVDGGFTDDEPHEQWLDDPEVDTIIIHRIRFIGGSAPALTKRTNFLSCWAAVHQIVTDEMNESRIAKAIAAGKKLIIHETITPRPKLITSKNRAASNYQHAYDHCLATRPFASLGEGDPLIASQAQI